MVAVGVRHACGGSGGGRLTCWGAGSPAFGCACGVLTHSGGHVYFRPRHLSNLQAPTEDQFPEHFTGRRSQQQEGDAICSCRPPVLGLGDLLRLCVSGETEQSPMEMDLADALFATGGASGRAEEADGFSKAHRSVRTASAPSPGGREVEIKRADVPLELSTP